MTTETGAAIPIGGQLRYPIPMTGGSVTNAERRKWLVSTAQTLAGARRLAGLKLAGLGLAGALPLAGCGWIDTRQRAAVYRPDRRVPASFRGLAATDESFILSSGSGQERGPMVMWWLPNADRSAPGLLYLHGTFRNLYHNHPKMEAIRAAGFSVLGVDYRGWGDSVAILPSEDTIYEDTELAWAELCRRVPDAGKRAIFGHSMGTGAATYLAERVQRKAQAKASLLVIESSFTKLTDVARAATAWGYPLAWFATQEFDSLSRISKLTMPVLMLHGARDRTIPIELGRQLYSAVNAPKEFVEFPEGTHSELHTEDPDLYRSAFRRWSSKLR